MTKKKNTGFSMVEILIAVTIFAILMIPIVSTIVSSLKMSTNAKELQYRNEFAEHMMEHIKSVPIKDIQSTEYYLNNGSSSVSVTESTDTTEVKWDLDGDGTQETTEELSTSKYVITGKTKLGTQNTPYNYTVEVDNQYYVDKRAGNVDFIDPNNLALGIVEDIDYRKVALIDGTILNYDMAASNAFMSKKLQNLRDESEERYQQEIEGGKYTTSNFARDKGSRLIRIEVSGKAETGYTVKCIMDYMDTSSYSNGEIVTYTPYAQTFTKLPNIYLMYNPCYYNSMYANDDYIALDTTGIKDDIDDMPEVNVFIVEIARTYSKNITDSNSLDPKLPTILYNDVVSDTDSNREQCKIHLTTVLGDTESDDSSDNLKKRLKKISVYHNIGDNYDEDYQVKVNRKTSINNFWYRKEALLSSSEKLAGVKDPIDTTLGSFASKINKRFCAIQPSDDTAYVGALNTATDENRGLYQVKIWLKEEANGAIDTSTEPPILQGTKGGNES